MPDVLRRLVAYGASVATTPGTTRPTALLSRRILFEQVLRQAASVEPGITLVAGHADRVVRERGRAVGIQVDGRTLRAELVIDASGRASRVTSDIRLPAVVHPCGAAYVSRRYQLRAHGEAGPVNSPIGLSLSFNGYSAIVFVHDNRTFSAVLIYDGADRQLRKLRRATVFKAALSAIPALNDWVDPDRSFPITGVLPGGRLYNTYRGQLAESGRPAAVGMISIGDSVCTTTPLAGRGVAMALMQSRALHPAARRTRERPSLMRDCVRPMVFRQRQAMVRRPHRRRYRTSATVGGRRRRPHPPTALGSHRRSR